MNKKRIREKVKTLEDRKTENTHLSEILHIEYTYIENKRLQKYRNKEK